MFTISSPPCVKVSHDGEIIARASHSVCGGYPDGNGGGVLYWAYSKEEAEHVAKLLSENGYSNIHVEKEERIVEISPVNVSFMFLKNIIEEVAPEKMEEVNLLLRRNNLTNSGALYNLVGAVDILDIAWCDRTVLGAPLVRALEKLGREEILLHVEEMCPPPAEEE